MQEGCRERGGIPQGDAGPTHPCFSSQGSYTRATHFFFQYIYKVLEYNHRRHQSAASASERVCVRARECGRVLVCEGESVCNHCVDSNSSRKLDELTFFHFFFSFIPPLSPFFAFFLSQDFLQICCIFDFGPRFAWYFVRWCRGQVLTINRCHIFPFPLFFPLTGFVWCICDCGVCG